MTDTIAANLLHAAHNRQSADIGGGTFGPEELRAAGKALIAYGTLLEALKECVTDPGAHCYGADDHRAYIRRLSMINVLASAAIFKATGELP